MINQSQYLVRRWIMFFAGMFLMGTGIVLSIKAGLGVSPISGVTTILWDIQPRLSLGAYSFIVNSLLFIGEFIVAPKTFSPKAFIQLVPTFLTSVFIDINMWMFGFLTPTGYAERMIVLLIGCVVLGLCFALMVTADLILMPTEAFISVMADKAGKEWGQAKVWLDVAMVIITVVVSLLYFRTVRNIREGTLISAILVGQVTRLMSRFTDPLVPKEPKPIEAETTA